MNVMKDWNSLQYTKFETERTQPVIDLIHRISCSPASILDIGCGPGNSTNQLRLHFPNAKLLGIDSSDNMLAKAEKTYPDLTFCRCVVPDELDSIGKFDLIFFNACLQWVPDHRHLLPKLISRLNDGGMLAVQMPLTKNAMFYQILEAQLSADRWQHLRGMRNFHILTPHETYDVLVQASPHVTMWDTTYYHALPSHSAVIEWYKGSGLRPYLDALDPVKADEFLAELLERIQKSYPPQADGSVILKMPRLFFTASK